MEMAFEFSVVNRTERGRAVYCVLLLCEMISKGEGNAFPSSYSEQTAPWLVCPSRPDPSHSLSHPQHSGYSYQPPSVDRPAFTYKPQTSYKPTTFRPRYSSRSSEELDSRSSPYFSSSSSSVFPSHHQPHFGSSGRYRHSHETDSSEEEERSYRKSSSSSSSSSSSHFGGRRSKGKGSSFPPRSSSSHHSRLPSNVHRRAERPHKHSSSSSSSSSSSDSSFSFSSGGSSSSFNIYGK
ncbi:hypothetical protein E2C01_080296 [Portunus trituberculatus]|uniref:Uncharacterized protein n=1 Tax=Portunus trituberculatus TaxID=210409 RepID=A0A5B7IVP2_PORTR|nr:hypothetical protein [Portunus trituberculatus]